MLEELVGLGLVTRVEVGQGSARYEAARPDGHHHHHMVCDRCGDVQPFADAELERAVDRLAARVAFDVAEHEIVLHGECAAVPEVGVTREQVQAWLDAYVDAWRSCEPSTIGALFSADATYAYHPYDEPERGREAIVASWLSEPDAARSWEARYAPLSSTALARSRPARPSTPTAGASRTSSSCASTRDGRCSEFVEWYIENPAGA